LSRRVPHEPVHLDLAPAVRPIHRPRAALHELPLSAFSSGCVVLPRFPRHRYAFGMEQTTRHRRGCHLGRTRYPVFLLERHGSHPSFPARSRRATSAGSMLGWSSLEGMPETALSETRRQSCDAAKEAVQPASLPASPPCLEPSEMAAAKVADATLQLRSTRHCFRSASVRRIGRDHRERQRCGLTSRVGRLSVQITCLARLDARRPSVRSKIVSSSSLRWGWWSRRIG